MMANAAALAALTLFLLAMWLGSRLAFLAPYRVLLLQDYGPTICLVTLLAFVDLCAMYYAIARGLFVRETGRKLAHVDRQLASPDAAIEDLRIHFPS